MSTQPHSAANEVIVRQARPEDAETCGRICFDAFSAINAKHGFPCDFPNSDVTKGLLTGLFSHPGFYCVVAEADGNIVGSNALDERAVIAGIGPITVDPSTQNLGVGRKLMQAVMDRAKEHGALGTRLVQAAFHNRSLSLYTSLGFDVREPLSCMQGIPVNTVVAGCTVRNAQPSDLDPCNTLAKRIYGYDRGGDLAQSIEQGSARVVQRDGRITGYSSALAFFGHTVAESNQDLKALIASAPSFGGAGILVPTRNSDVFRWCLANGLRVMQPLTLMSVGPYTDPTGAWLPSILF